MKLLLDTHIWIWSLLEPVRLKRRVARELESAGNELWLSPISTWEVLMLHVKRRIEVREPMETWIARALSTKPMREAPITHEVALATHRISFPHGDPADRFLLATAMVFGLTLVTADEQLIECREVPILANR